MSPSRRVSLADLGTAAATRVAEPTAETAQEPPTPLETASQAQAPSDEQPPSKGPRPTSRRRKPSPPVGEWQRFDTYERKEARLRSDQYGALSDTARRLQRSRATKGERITENTLIRVAVDLLLSRADELAGESEAELRQSVGL